MDYIKLARQFLEYTCICQNHNHQRIINESMEGESFLLLYLLKRGDKVTPSEIGKEMNISSARVAVILNKLEEKSCVEREIDKDDRRRILVNLTDKGLLVAKNHNEKVINMTAQMLKLLGPKDAKELVRITGKLSDIIPEIKYKFDTYKNGK